MKEQSKIWRAKSRKYNKNHKAISPWRNRLKKRTENAQDYGPNVTTSAVCLRRKLLKEEGTRCN